LKSAGLKLLVGVALAGVLVLLLLRDPATSGFFPPCPMHYLTGLYCPGCGTLRSLYRLFHGDLAGALSMNALMMISIPFLLYYGASLVREWTGGAPLPGVRVWGAKPRLLAGILILYTVLRNLPVEPFCRLAPG
jgi:hypothetical protein